MELGSVEVETNAPSNLVVGVRVADLARSSIGEGGQRSFRIAQR